VVALRGRTRYCARLKDELFVLETDRLAGRLSEAEYAEHKAAFDVGAAARAGSQRSLAPARLMMKRQARLHEAAARSQRRL